MRGHSGRHWLLETSLVMSSLQHAKLLEQQDRLLQDPPLVLRELQETIGILKQMLSPSFLKNVVVRKSFEWYLLG